MPSVFLSPQRHNRSRAAHMPKAPVNGIELYYEVHGNGPAVVFAHGAGGNHLSWWQQVPVLARQYRCISFDHRGFGQSPRSEEHTSELQSPYDLVCRLLLEKKNAAIPASALAVARQVIGVDV